MSKLDDLFGGHSTPPTDPQENRAQGRPDGVPWDATVECQVCEEDVYDQTFYPTESILLWTCSQGHRSFIEGFRIA